MVIHRNLIFFLLFLMTVKGYTQSCNIELETDDFSGKKQGKTAFQIVGRNGSEPLIAPMFYERLEASTRINSEGKEILVLKYVDFRVDPYDRNEIFYNYEIGPDDQVIILLKSGFRYELPPDRKTNMSRNTYEVTRFDRPHRNTIHSISTFFELPPDFIQKIADDPVTGVRFVFYDRDADNTRNVNVFSDGRERDGKRARDRFAERYRQGWLDLLECHQQLKTEAGL